MKIGLFTNLTKDKDLSVTNSFIEAIKAQGQQCFISDVIKEDLKCDKLSASDMAETCDIIITLGGDGTMLHFIRQVKQYDFLIIGVNLGNVGFMTEVENCSIDELIKHIVLKKYSIEERNMLRCVHNSCLYNALNEVVISNVNALKLISVDVYIDDILIDTYVADGVLASTATGSTAYSLSAGGPIMSPDISGFILNAICSHSLHTRPIIISDSHKVKFILNKSTAESSIIIDGEKSTSIINGESIELSISPDKIKFLKINDINFYNRVKLKLNTWAK